MECAADKVILQKRQGNVASKGERGSAHLKRL